MNNNDNDLQSVSINTTILDMFDECLHVEEQHVEQGFEEGVKYVIDMILWILYNVMIK